MLNSPLKAPHISTSSRCVLDTHPTLVHDVVEPSGITVELGLFGEWHSGRPPHRWQRVAPFDKKAFPQASQARCYETWVTAICLSFHKKFKIVQNDRFCPLMHFQWSECAPISLVFKMAFVLRKALYGPTRPITAAVISATPLIVALGCSLSQRASRLRHQVSWPQASSRNPGGKQNCPS
jgi:hypothetical protein